MPAEKPRIEEILRTASDSPLDQLLPVVYHELKRIAHHHLGANETATLCTTELVHEAYFKLAAGKGNEWEGRAHFFGAASRAMRQVLVDFARRRKAAKRSADADQVTLGDGDAALDIQLDEILAIDEALEQLDAVDPRLRRVVELRFFAGLPENEIASILGVSTRTVERDWLKARLFLLGALDRT
jgi:RNA polymerase sigma factor (TIGR02999 family)